jgi:hypothetical protein
MCNQLNLINFCFVFFHCVTQGLICGTFSAARDLHLEPEIFASGICCPIFLGFSVKLYFFTPNYF